MKTSTPKPNYTASIIIVAVTIVAFLGIYLYNRPSKEEKELAEIGKQTFLLKVNQNQSILNSAITEQGVLALSVYSDGVDKSNMATYYCRLAKEEGIEIESVKILDASNARFEEGAAYGTELAQIFCND